jgi:hypothetical protein
MPKPERGIPSLMMMPTPLEPSAASDDQGGATEQGGETAGATPKPRARRRRIDPGEKTRGHKLSLPDAVFERLELTAIRRKSTVSAIAAEILDRNLPRLRIEQDG